MAKTQQDAPAAVVVKKTLLVNCSQEKAFDAFTKQIGQWWPPAHHLGKLPFLDVVIEPRTGGGWYEVDANKGKCPWGRVLAWEAPRRVLLAWHLNAKFEFDPDPDRASEIELRFLAAGPHQTRVEFEHRAIERHGEGYEKLRDSLDGGWAGILDEFVRVASHSGSAQRPSH
jgi:hypothetical protein